MKSNRVLLTGATGFIGRHLVAALHDREIHVLTRPGADISMVSHCRNLKVHLYDGSSKSVIDAVINSQPGLVVHLAAFFVAEHKSDEVEWLIKSNILLGTQLLEAMRTCGARDLINTGTSWQNFENSDGRSVCLYAATKQAFESLIDFYVDAYSFRVITLKLFDTYGPRDPRAKLFTILRTADPTKPLRMSEGHQLVDLVYIDDVVAAFLAGERHLIELRSGIHERFGVSSCNPRPLREVVEYFLREAKSDLNVEWGARPYRAREVMKPWSLFNPIPGWQPRISLEEGISRLLNDDQRGAFPVH